MAAYTKEQADALLAQGKIDPQTHALMIDRLGAMSTEVPSTSFTAPVGGFSANPTGPDMSGGFSSAPPPTASPISTPPPDPKAGFLDPSSPLAQGLSAQGIAPYTPPPPQKMIDPYTREPVLPEYDPSVGSRILGVGLPGAAPMGVASPVPQSPQDNQTPFGPPAPPQKAPNYSQSNVVSAAAAPAGLPGPSSDPRVNTAYAKFQKQYAGVREAEREVEKAQGEAAAREWDRDRRLADNAKEWTTTISELRSQSDKDWSDYKAASDAQLQNIRLAADQAAAGRVDPERFWKEKGTAGTIAAVVGMALGALGSAMARTPNFALQIVDNAIARDIAAQEKNLDQNWKKVDSERGLLGDLRQVYGDKRLARSEAYKQAYDRTVAVGDQIAAESKNPIAQANWQKTRAELVQKRAAYDYDVLQQLEEMQRKRDAAAASATLAAAAKVREKFLDMTSGDNAISEAEAARRLAGVYGASAVDTALKGFAQGVPLGVRGAEGTKADRTAAEKLGKELGPLETALETAQDVKQHFAPRGTYREGGQYMWAPNVTRSEQSIADEQKLRQLAFGLAKARSPSAEPNDRAVDDNIKVIRGDGSAAALERGINDATREIESRIAGVRAGESDAANALYDARRNQRVSAQQAARQAQSGPVGAPKLPGNK